MIPLGVLASSVADEPPWIDEDFNGLSGSIRQLRLHDRTAAPVSMSVYGEGFVTAYYGNFAVTASRTQGTFLPPLPLDEVGRKVRVRVDVIHPNAQDYSRPCIMIGCYSQGFTLGFRIYPVWGQGLHVVRASQKWFAPISGLTGPATVEVEYHLRGVADHVFTVSVNGDKVLAFNTDTATMGDRIGLGLDGAISSITPIFDNLKVWVS